MEDCAQQATVGSKGLQKAEVGEDFVQQTKGTSQLEFTGRPLAVDPADAQVRSSTADPADAHVRPFAVDPATFFAQVPFEGVGSASSAGAAWARVMFNGGGEVQHEVLPHLLSYGAA